MIRNLIVVLFYAKMQSIESYLLCYFAPYFALREIEYDECAIDSSS